MGSKGFIFHPIKILVIAMVAFPFLPSAPLVPGREDELTFSSVRVIVESDGVNGPLMKKESVEGKWLK